MVGKWLCSRFTQEKAYNVTAMANTWQRERGDIKVVHTGIGCKTTFSSPSWLQTVAKWGLPVHSTAIVGNGSNSMKSKTHHSKWLHLIQIKAPPSKPSVSSNPMKPQING